MIFSWKFYKQINCYCSQLRHSLLLHGFNSEYLDVLPSRQGRDTIYANVRLQSRACIYHTRRWSPRYRKRGRHSSRRAYYSQARDGIAIIARCSNKQIRALTPYKAAMLYIRGWFILYANVYMYATRRDICGRSNPRAAIGQPRRENWPVSETLRVVYVSRFEIA